MDAKAVSGPKKTQAWACAQGLMQNKREADGERRRKKKKMASRKVRTDKGSHRAVRPRHATYYDSAGQTTPFLPSPPYSVLYPEIWSPKVRVSVALPLPCPVTPIGLRHNDIDKLRRGKSKASRLACMNAT